MRTFFMFEMQLFAWTPCCLWAMSQSAVICLRRDIVFDSDETLCDIKSPDKSQGNAIIRSIIADYFVPKILSPASPRPGTM